MCVFRKKPKPTPIPVPTPVPVRPTVGVVAHRILAEDVAALRTMGVRHVRLSLYPDDDGAQHIDAALAAGFDVLAVAYRTAAQHASDVARWPTVLWQIGNEPHWPGITAEQAADAARAGQVSPGLANGTPAEWVSAYCAASDAAQVVALHVYGDVLAGVMHPVAAVPASRVCWITEIGHTDAAQLDLGLRAIDGARVARVYVYALVSDGDKYTLSIAHQMVIRRFIAST